MSLVERMRKTKDPCGVCRMHHNFCICSHIPRLHLKTKVSLVIHYREMRRTSNTGSLAVHALENSNLIVRGQNKTKLDLSSLISSDYETCLLYPSEQSVNLADFKSERPIHLIVPDGSWRQASKVGIRHPELAHLPRVTLKIKNEAKHHLRKEHFEEGMSTLEAIAHALQILEGDEAGNALKKLYQAKLHATLKARGIAI